jgi:hypothetical protein
MYHRYNTFDTHTHIYVYVYVDAKYFTYTHIFPKEIKKVKTILKYFRCMIGNTAEAWSCCSSRSNGDMLRVWFSISPFVSSDRGVKTIAPLEVCTKNKKRGTVRFLVSKGMKGAEIHRQLATKYGQNCLQQWSVYEWTEMFKSSQTTVVDADR